MTSLVVVVVFVVVVFVVVVVVVVYTLHMIGSFIWPIVKSMAASVYQCSPCLTSAEAHLIIHVNFNPYTNVADHCQYGLGVGMLPGHRPGENTHQFY